MNVKLFLLGIVVSFSTCGCNRASSTPPPPPASQPTEVNHTSFHTRGQVVAPIFTKAGQGFAVVLDHEDIPGLMPAMRMEYRLVKPSDASQLKAGEKIAFDIAEQPEGDFAVTHIVPLPADTTLKLAPPPATTEPK